MLVVASKHPICGFLDPTKLQPGHDADIEVDTTLCPHLDVILVPTGVKGRNNLEAAAQDCHCKGYWNSISHRNLVDLRIDPIQVLA